MSDAHGLHIEAVGLAGLEIQESENILSAAMERLELAIGAVINAVGENPTQESGRNALEFAVGAKERMSEIRNMLEQCKAELNRYGSGF